MSFYPTKEEQKKTKKFIEVQKILIPIALHEIKGSKKVIEVGSTAKGTFVSGDYDIDLYILTSEPEKAFKIISEKILQGQKKEGQLLIWNAKIDKFDVDYIFITPKAKKREDTIQHTEFFNKRLTPKMKKEVIKAKAYFKTKGVYGAEVAGIVGICLEELIRQHKTLEKACKFLAFSAKRPTLQDPTLSCNRNLLASINPRRWTQLVSACLKFTRNPKHKFRFNPMTTEKFLKKHKDYCTIMFKRLHDKGKDFHALYSASTHAGKILWNREAKEVAIDYDSWIDEEKVVLVYKVRPFELSEYKEHCINPSDLKKEDLEKFKEVHQDSYEKQGNICAMIKRNIQFPDTFFYSETIRRMKEKGYSIW